AERELLVLQLFRSRIVMRRGEEHVAGLRVDERARRLADARRDARDVATGHIHQIDLIEGSARLALDLEDELTAVLRPIPLAGAASFHRETTDPREEVSL